MLTPQKEDATPIKKQLSAATPQVGTGTWYLSHTFLNVSAKTISMIRKDITFGND